MLEVIEGKPPLPRQFPPYEQGLFARSPETGWEASPVAIGSRRDDPHPTLVNNVETLANVPHILARGAEWFRTMGTAESPGTIVCTVVGDVLAPDVGEAQCHACTEWFELAQLYAADPADADRCPNCTVHLGSAGLGHTTFRIERHIKAFSEALRSLADNPGAFTIDSSGVHIRALEAIDRLDQPPALDSSTRIAAPARL